LARKSSGIEQQAELVVFPGKTVHDHQQRDPYDYGRKIDCSDMSKRAGTDCGGALFLLSDEATAVGEAIPGGI
jgi:hypothetical protein